MNLKFAIYVQIRKPKFYNTETDKVLVKLEIPMIKSGISVKILQIIGLSI
jgi:hypothetical protein